MIKLNKLIKTIKIINSSNTIRNNNNNTILIQIRHLNKKLFPSKLNPIRESKGLKKFNQTLITLSKQGNLNHVEDYINTKLIEPPNLFTYSILMNTYNYSNNHDKVLKIWDYLITNNSISFIRLHSHFSILIDSIKFNSTLKELETIWSKNKMKPLSSNNYLSYLESLIFFEKFELALKCYEIEVLDMKKCLPTPAMKQLIEAELEKTKNLSLLRKLDEKYETCRNSWNSINILRNNKSY